MVTLLGAMLGFLTSMLPQVFKLYQDKYDRAHELAILELQLRQQEISQSERLEAIHTAADIAESKALYRTFYSGVKWVDALNASVRPVLAYAFFCLYAAVKLVALLTAPMDALLNVELFYEMLWTQEDAAIFAGIISFYFGQRAMNKMRSEGR